MSRMDASNENNPFPLRSSNYQGGFRMGGAKVVAPPVRHNHRRALGAINQNTIQATHLPCVVNKKELSGKDVICEKNKALPVNTHRPITRRYAAQMVSNQQHFEEGKKSSHSSSGTLNDCTPIDVEEYGNVEEQPVPMFVKHTEAMMDEIDRIVEVEMEDAEDPVLDIDENDKENPLAVVEYIDDIYAYYLKVESHGRVSPNYMSQQFDINGKMRAILIDWLIEVHYKFELMDETLFLTVNIIDRFLEHHTVIRKKLQLVGVTAMLLACKYEEVSVPIVEDFILISDKAYARKEVLDMERLMLNALQFNMSVPTPYVFMRRFLKAAQADRKLELLSFFIVELCLVEYEMLKFPPSLLAAAAIYTAQCTLSKTKAWGRTNQWYTNYSEDQLLECSRMMVTFHQKAKTGKLTGVFRKYNTSKHDYTSKSEPARFLLEI